MPCQATWRTHRLRMEREVVKFNAKAIVTQLALPVLYLDLHEVRTCVRFVVFSVEMRSGVAFSLKALAIVTPLSIAPFQEVPGCIYFNWAQSILSSCKHSLHPISPNSFVSVHFNVVSLLTDMIFLQTL